jgi:hypothetical protein
MMIAVTFVGGIRIAGVRIGKTKLMMIVGVLTSEEKQKTKSSTHIGYGYVE